MTFKPLLREYAGYDADLRDVQFIISFNPKAIDSIVKGDSIDFTQVKSIQDLQSFEDLENYVISTSNRDSLVNFFYSVMGEGDSITGGCELVDNNGIFLSFVNQRIAIASREWLSMYVVWGYGKNRAHWSSIHKVIISNISYNIHEGNKIVNIQFASQLEDASRNLKSEIYISTPTKRPDSLGYRSFGDRAIINLKPNEPATVLTEIISQAAEHTFKYGLHSNTEIYVDKGQILNALRDSKAFSDASMNPPLFWMRLASDVGAINYHPSIELSAFNGKYDPGSPDSLINTIIPILPRTDDYTKFRRDLETKIRKRLRDSILKNKNLSDIRSNPRRPSSDLVKNNPRKTIKLTEKEIQDERKRQLDKIYSNAGYRDDFPVVTYFKPANVDPISFFRKFLSVINVRCGTNIRYVVDDTSDNLSVFVAQNFAQFRNERRKLLPNFNGRYKNLYSPKTGFRKIKSINPKGKKLIEDLYTGEINLSYNENKSSLIEKLTVDVVFTEFFSWFNKVFNFSMYKIGEYQNVNDQYYLSNLEPLVKVLNQYMKKFSYTDHSGVEDFLSIVNSHSIIKKELKKESLIVNIHKSVIDSVEEYLKLNRQQLIETVVRDLMETELNYLTVKIAIPGIPELDDFTILNYGRAVNLTVIDPSPNPEKEEVKFISGKYFIKGFKHEITIGNGYTTYLNLFKPLDKSFFVEIEN